MNYRNTPDVSKSPSPAVVPAWEQLNSSFASENEKLEQLIAILSQKVQPLIDQRPTPAEPNDTKISPNRLYNSPLFQSLQEKAELHRALNNRLSDIIESIEI